jgi:hypothetical protein
VRNKDARYFRHPLESRDWNRLEILELILQVCFQLLFPRTIHRRRIKQPHTVQTIMSAENTPVLAATIPAFELFMSSWESMLDDSDLEDENVAQIISPGLDIAKKYYNKFADTDAYLIAMCKYEKTFSADTNVLKSHQPFNSLRMDAKQLVLRGSRICTEDHFGKGTGNTGAFLCCY